MRDLGQETSLFLMYSIHFVLVLFLASEFMHKKNQTRRRGFFTLIFLGLIFCIFQIQQIIENETTLKIISPTKLNISYLLLFFSSSIFIYWKNKLNLFLWIIISWLSILYFLAFQLTGVGFNESIPFHLKSGIKGAGIGDFYQLIFAVTTAVLLLGVSIYYGFKNLSPTRNNSFSSLILFCFLLGNPLNFDIYQTYKEVEENPNFLFKEHYIPQREKLDIKKKYNLVWIYAEAFERIYLNQEIFPGLTPNLTTLEKQSLSFSNIHQVWGTGWTIAGIASSQCGVPLYAVGRQNNDLNQLPNFLPKIKGIGNILQENGYQNIFIQGSPKNFAGNDKFLESHGFQFIGFENFPKKLNPKPNPNH